MLDDSVVIEVKGKKCFISNFSMELNDINRFRTQDGSKVLIEYIKNILGADNRVCEIYTVDQKCIELEMKIKEIEKDTSLENPIMSDII